MTDTARNRRLRDRRYLALFITMLTMVVLQSFGLSFGAHQIFSDFVVSAVVLMIFHVVLEGVHARTLTLLAAGVVLLVQWAYYVLPEQNLRQVEVLQHLFYAAFFALALTIILRDMFGKRQGGGDHIFGAMSGYLIGGMAWAQLNALAWLLLPAAYDFARELGSELADRHKRIAIFTYYSFTQLFTLGYADVTPVEAPATTLSVLEALYGVFYLAAVVSQFVGMQQKSDDHKPGH